MHTEASASTINEQLINKENPWPGLSAFTEENALFFHGRDKEADELFRLIKRETLTVLFGLSGLGKTSLLQAGIFPFLRREDYLPVYVRLNYVEGAPDLVTQVKETLREGAEKAAVSSPPVRPGETLWAYFHLTANDFKTEEGKIITPVLVFDQFEEMFTLGSNSDECQHRITDLLTQLGDLIENRPPEAVEQQLDAGNEEAYSFYKNDYKVVFTLREDFLANLEGLCNQLPSITNNRFRLQKMNGAQALDVILKSGGALVDEIVAEKIVKMVAGRDAYASVALNTLEIEPTLLSVFCRELNNTRIARGDAKITAQLLSGSKEVILTGFYDRALKGFDERLRFFIEDKLLTGSGFRNSVDLQDALTMPGVSRDAIFNLIDRRLLRIEDSSRMPRVELTHDVLTDVIKKSRDDRKARETARSAEVRAKEAAEEIRSKEKELREANQRNLVLKFIVLVALVCLAASIYLYNDARAAKHAADVNFAKIRYSNDTADELIGFTLSDLHKKLSGIGRVSWLDEAAAQALPLLKQQSTDEHGMSDTQYYFQELVYGTLGDVARSDGRLSEALDDYKHSIDAAQKLVDESPQGTPDHLRYLKELAERLSGVSNTLDAGSEADALVAGTKFAAANDLYDKSLKITDQIEALSTDPQDKVWVERQRANIYGRQGDIFRSTGQFELALAPSYQKSLELRKEVADSDPTNQSYKLDLANAYSRIGYVQSALGHFNETLQAYGAALGIRQEFAKQHLDDVNWQRSLFYSYLTIGRLLVLEGKLTGNDGALFNLTTGLKKETELTSQNPANPDLHRESAIGYLFLGNYYRAAGDWPKADTAFNQGLLEMLSKQDPNNVMWKNFFGVAYLDVGDSQAQQGKFAEAAQSYQSALEVFLQVVKLNKNSSDWQHNLALAYERLGYLSSLRGNAKDAEKYFGEAKNTYDTTIQLNQKDPVTYNGRAWLLATCPIDSQRNGAQAVKDATLACQLSEHSYWEDFDTLAAADAEAGNFKQAVSDEQAALKLIDPSDANERAGINSRLILYEGGKPYHFSTVASSDRYPLASSDR